MCFGGDEALCRRIYTISSLGASVGKHGDDHPIDGSKLHPRTTEEYRVFADQRISLFFYSWSDSGVASSLRHVS